MKKLWLLPLSALFVMAFPQTGSAESNGLYSTIGATKCSDVNNGVAAVEKHLKSAPESAFKLHFFQAYGLGIADVRESACRSTKPKEECTGDELTPNSFLAVVLLACKTYPDKVFGDQANLAWEFLQKTNIDNVAKKAKKK